MRRTIPSKVGSAAMPRGRVRLWAPYSTVRVPAIPTLKWAWISQIT